MNRRSCAVAALFFLLTQCGTPATAQPKVLATRPSSSKPSTRPTTSTVKIGSRIDPPADAMARNALETLYQHELGDLWPSVDRELLYQSHCLIEKYFVAEYAEDRKALAKWIGQLGIEPNILGRITRIRMDWPAIDGGVYYVNERVGPHDVAYFMGVPQGYDRAVSWPLVIMLPASVPFATKPPPDADAVTQLYTGWVNDELKKHPDAVVVMPLLNLRELWGPSYAGMFNVFGPLQHAANRLNIDPARVYLVGHSMSGHATWNLALHYPTYFAAINPMAGAASQDWQRLRMMNLRNVYPVIWHDADDLVIPVKHSRELVAILKKFKFDFDYEETAKVGHAPPAEQVERCYQKMCGRIRDLYPHDVPIQSNRLDTLFNRSDWVQMYQAITPGKDQRILLRHGTGPLVMQANPMSAQAILRAQNKVDVKTANLEVIRFYFNDQMVDFSKPVTVSINGKVRFDKLLKPNVDDMLTDQLFLGRGWRYYTAVVDIDFGEPATKPAAKPFLPR